MKTVFWLCIMVLKYLARVSSSQNLSAHPTYLRFGLFCNFFGDFSVYLGINILSQRISKIYGNGKF